MHDQRGRHVLTLALLFGAMIFGMVLAGGTELLPASIAAAEPPRGGAVEVPHTVAARGLPSLADLAAAVSPAVVSIQVTTFAEEGRGNRGGVDPFEFFFGPRRRQPDSQDDLRRRPQPQRSSGSGFVISEDGLIVTNHHVIEGADGLVVNLNGRQYPAEVKGDDPATDIALIQIEPDEPLTYLELGDSGALRVGDWVMVIGSPLQLENSVSVGVVSAKGRAINITADRGLENFIQTDAAINFGNSGGPLVDLDGRVVGIATAINFGAENIGFAVPAETLSQILPQLRDHGSVERGYLGVEITDLDHDTAAAFGLDGTAGSLVARVTADGPADDAGLSHGDIILEVDGKPVNDNRELIDNISARRPGEKVELTIFRNEKRKKVEVELGQRNLAQTAAVTPRPDDETTTIDWLGIQYQALTDQARSSHNIPEGVAGVWITDVAPDSPLYDENVRPGDVIAEVNGRPIGGVDQFQELVEGAGSGSFLRLYVTRVDPRSGTTNSFFAIVRVP